MIADLIYDNMDDTGGKPIVVRALLTLLSTKDGGRKTPIIGKLRPNHNFSDENNRLMYIGQIEIGEGESLAPGETKQVTVVFLNVRGISEHLKVGRVWRVQEGLKLIGTAKVISIEEKT